MNQDQKYKIVLIIKHNINRFHYKLLRTRQLQFILVKSFSAKFYLNLTLKMIHY